MRDPLRTPVCDLLGIEVPIALAPMAGGPGTPELAGAVAAAGGLGCLPLTGLTAAAAEEQVRRARTLARGAPVVVNVQVAPPRRATTTQAALAPVLERLAAGAPAPGPPPAADPPEALLEAALDAGAAGVSTALGDPAPYAPLARARGVPLIASTSTVDEARRAAAAGAAVVVAQGAEAGGHRTTFDVDAGPLPLVGTVVLVPRTAAAVGVPVLAAGGIGDGRGVAAALALGAQGVWLGTRFLACAEAGTAPAQRALLARLDETSTVVTDAVTGRHARWVANGTTAELASAPGHLGWPGQGAAVRPVLGALARQDDLGRVPLLAGQGAGAAPPGEPAGEVVRALADEARAVLRALAGG